MELDILNYNGEKTGRKAKLDDSLFSIEPNEHAIYLDVKRIQAGRRKGNAKTKERSDLSGSGTKLRRQKGTGFARVGDIKSPIFRGGATVFGPQPRDYSLKVNKKVQKLARRSAVAAKLQANQLYVVEDLDFDEPKTRFFAAFLDNLSLGGEKTLMVTNQQDSNVSLSLRNIPEVEEKEARSINTEVLLKYQYVVVSESAVNHLEATVK